MINYSVEVILGFSAGAAIAIGVFVALSAVVLGVLGMGARSFTSITRRVDRLLLLAGIVAGGYLAFRLAGDRLEASFLTLVGATYVWRRFLKRLIYSW